MGQGSRRPDLTTRRLIALPIAAFATAVAACTLTTSFDGLSDGTTPPLGDGSTSDGLADASADTSTTSDTSAGPRSYRDEVLADSPLSYWRMGEASGMTAASEVSGGTDGTYVGGVTFGAPGAIAGDTNTAVTLDGTGRMSLDKRFPFDQTSPYTLEAWAKPATIDTSYRRIFSREQFPTNRQGYLVWIQSEDGWGSERFQDDLGDGVNTSSMSVPPPPPTGAYYHVVATYDADQLMHLYINGQEPMPASPSAKSITRAPHELGIGCTMNGAIDCFVGSIDEVAIYDHALSSERVSAHYRAGTGKK